MVMFTLGHVSMAEKSISMRFCYKYQYFKICHTKGHNFLTYIIAKYAAKWGLIATVDFNDIAEEAIEKMLLL